MFVRQMKNFTAERDGAALLDQLERLANPNALLAVAHRYRLYLARIDLAEAIQTRSKPVQ